MTCHKNAVVKIVARTRTAIRLYKTVHAVETAERKKLGGCSPADVCIRIGERVANRIMFDGRKRTEDVEHVPMVLVASYLVGLQKLMDCVRVFQVVFTVSVVHNSNDFDPVLS